MAAALSGTVPWQGDTLYCYRMRYLPVLRAPAPETSFFRQDWNKKFFMSHSTYPFLTYPDFCLGWIWAATPATLHTLLEQVIHSSCCHLITPSYIVNPPGAQGPPNVPG